MSAYLDGQLGPEEQQAVESALLEDPRLAEELRGLAAVRDLLAGLPREAPVDLTSRVMRRVRRRALLGPARGLVAWGPVRAAGLAAAAAAALMMLAAPWLLPAPRRDGGGADVLALRGAIEGPRPGTPAAAHWPAFVRADERTAAAEGSVADRADSRATDDGPGTGSNPSDPLRQYLDHPHLRHLFLVSDRGDGSDVQRVASVVEQTTRFKYFKITVAQGIMLDPRHPDQATVFALVVDPRELVDLRGRLRAAMNDRVEEETAEPGEVARLADLGQAEACTPSPAAELDIPRQEMAIKFRPAGPGAEPARPGEPERPPGPTPEQERSSPRAEVLARDEPGRPPARKEDADETLVVLVWVSRARPG